MDEQPAVTIFGDLAMRRETTVKRAGQYAVQAAQFARVAQYPCESITRVFAAADKILYTLRALPGLV
jgi:hypothetical protein